MYPADERTHRLPPTRLSHDIPNAQDDAALALDCTGLCVSHRQKPCFDDLAGHWVRRAKTNIETLHRAELSSAPAILHSHSTTGNAATSVWCVEERHGQSCDRVTSSGRWGKYLWPSFWRSCLASLL